MAIPALAPGERPELSPLAGLGVLGWDVADGLLLLLLLAAPLVGLDVDVAGRSDAW